VEEDAGAPLGGGPMTGISFVFSLSYISLRDPGCKTRTIHSFVSSERYRLHIRYSPRYPPKMAISIQTLMYLQSFDPSETTVGSSFMTLEETQLMMKQPRTKVMEPL
jgi:hypothetical protein